MSPGYDPSYDPRYDPGQYQYDPYQYQPPAPPQGSAPPQQRVPGQSYGSGSAGSNTDPTTTDPRQMYRQQRSRAIAFGDQIDQQARDRADYQGGIEDQYRQSADRQYDPLIHGQGGYTPEQAAGIRQQGNYDALRPTQEGNDANYLTDDEQTTMYGDPRSYQGYFSPDQARAVDTEGASRLREGYQDLGTRLDDATNTARGAYGEAIDPGRLRQGEGVAAGVMGGINSATGRIQAITGSKDLDLSADYAAKRGYTDQDVADIRNSAARKVGASGAEAIRSMEDRVAASGNASPMAMAAARERLLRGTNIDSADAMADADIKARQVQKNAMQEMEDTRLAAARFKAGNATQADLELLRTSTGAQMGLEQQRMGGEQYVTGARMKAAGDVAGIMSGNSQAYGNARMGAEGHIGDRESGTERWAQNTGIEREVGAEDRSQARGATIAQNRQGTQMYNSAQNYGRGMAITDREAANERRIADENQAQSREGRGYTTGQQAYAGGQYNTATGQRIQTQGQTAGQQQQAAQGYASWQQRPNRFMRNVLPVIQSVAGRGGSIQQSPSGGGGGGGGGGADWSDPSSTTGGGGGADWSDPSSTTGGGGNARGGVITKPTYALLGEEGPEMVVPLRRQQAMPMPMSTRSYGPRSPRMKAMGDMAPSWR